MEKTKAVGENVGFERIRRITGYLVGTLDHFNDAKYAEVQDRVKHSWVPAPESWNRLDKRSAEKRRGRYAVPGRLFGKEKNPWRPFVWRV